MILNKINFRVHQMNDFYIKNGVLYSPISHILKFCSAHMNDFDLFYEN